jgi:hypothetical protein
MHTRLSLRRFGLARSPRLARVTATFPGLFACIDVASLGAAMLAIAATVGFATASARADDAATAAVQSDEKTTDAPSKSSQSADDASKTNDASTSTTSSAGADTGTPSTTAPATRTRARSAASAYPGYVRSMDWELDFRPGPLRLYTDANGEAYWYFTYKVVNRTGKERMWAPRFEFFSDKGEIKASGRSVPTEVTRAVLDLLKNPLLEDQNQIIGELRIGEENAKDGVVIWPAKDLAVTEFTIFVTGASGKIRKVPDPRTGNPLVERWTLRFNYLVPGDPVARGSTPVDPVTADRDIADGALRRPNDVGVWLWR